MCGRTALTLGKEQIIKKCFFKKSQARNNPEAAASDDYTDDNPDNCDDSDIIVPVWNDAPCGGEYSPSPNIAPTLYTPILYRSHEQITLQPMMWGLIPPWHQGPGPKTHGLSTNNCRLEGVMDSKLYSPCLSSRRCVIVCEGFYEWLRQGSDKQPYFVFRPGQDTSNDSDQSRPLMYLAGLYSVWQDNVYSYTILTRESNKTLSWLHHRMPAFLHPWQVKTWLDPGTDVTSAMTMLDSGVPGDGDLSWYKVSKSVGNSRNQDMQLMSEVKEEKKQMNGLMSNWLKSGSSENKGSTKSSPTIKTVKKPDKSKSLMNNWLKRSCEENADSQDKRFKSDS